MKINPYLMFKLLLGVHLSTFCLGICFLPTHTVIPTSSSLATADRQHGTLPSYRGNIHLELDFSYRVSWVFLLAIVSFCLHTSLPCSVSKRPPPVYSNLPGSGNLNANLNY
jgi:hypothetical protein